MQNNSYQKIKIKELVDYIVDNRGRNPPYYSEDGIPVIDNFQITGVKHIDLGNSHRFIDEKVYDTFIRKYLNQGDLLITLVGNGFGNVAIAPREKSVIIQNTIGIRCNDKCLNNYLFYFLSANKNIIRDRNRGAAQPSIKVSDLTDIDIILPPLNSQQKIASILSAYDDLIENNNKRIKILEEIGKNLFLQLTKKISRDEIELSEILKLKSGYAFKSKDFNKQNTNNIVVRMGNFPPGGGLQFEDNMMYLSDVGPEKYLLKGGDLVMVLSDVTRDGRIIGNVGFIPQDNENNYYLNQRVSKIESEKENLFFLYELFNSSKFKSYCLSRANSATVLNLSNVHIYSYKVIMPSKVELSDFNKSIEPIINLIQNLTKKNKILKKSKNLLLPKLISGELDVEGLDIKIRPEIL